jgi:hypothetical protein
MGKLLATACICKYR